MIPESFLTSVDLPTTVTGSQVQWTSLRVTSMEGEACASTRSGPARASASVRLVTRVDRDGRRSAQAFIGFGACGEFETNDRCSGGQKREEDGGSHHEATQPDLRTSARIPGGAREPTGPACGGTPARPAAGPPAP